MNAQGKGGSLRAAIAHDHDLSRLLEDVDLEDTTVYLPMSSERAYVDQQYARHYQEFIAQERELEYDN